MLRSLGDIWCVNLKLSELLSEIYLNSVKFSQNWAKS